MDEDDFYDGNPEMDMNSDDDDEEYITPNKVSSLNSSHLEFS